LQRLDYSQQIITTTVVEALAVAGMDITLTFQVVVVSAVAVEIVKDLVTLVSLTPVVVAKVVAVQVGEVPLVVLVL